MASLMQASRPSPGARPLRMASVALIAATLAACTSTRPGVDAPATPVPPSNVEEATRPSDRVASVRLITSQTPAVRTYRRQGATQIYKTHPSRIFKGQLPPLMYAIAVVETDIDASGKVTGVYFSRVPTQAPEVPAEIERLIRAASPLPNPGRLGAHTYVDTWLWDKSGRFQLDTLTEGQRSR